MSELRMYNNVLSKLGDVSDVNSVVVSLSGGLDSTVLLHFLVKRFGAENVAAISFDYNQRHDVELEQAKKTVQKLNIAHTVIDISFLGRLAAGVSSMVRGEVATPTMEDILGDPQPTTYMPNRNMVLASIVAAAAESIGADTIALGIQKIDSYSYWDTTPEFYDALEAVFQLNRKNPIRFLAPFLPYSKNQEIRLGKELGVDFADTWTCYNPTITDAEDTWEQEPAGGRNRVPHKKYTPCGVCPSCKERAMAFWEADNTADPILAGVVV